jgi:BirA family transcriptional regulator, biotin operon repressor / biotin---[acetyl-CoA-carboxylase] ligase
MIGNNIIELQETASTNTYAFQLIKGNDVEEGSVISSISQQNGKGTGSNKWESEAGKNLTVSIVLKPVFLPLKKQFMLNIITSLSVCHMISQLLPDKESLKIKWPNDIYVGDNKISGILIENTIVGTTFDYSVAGIGININQEIFISDAPNPVSLKKITNKDYDLTECLTLLCSCIEERYMQLKNAEYDLLDKDYLSMLYRKGESAKFIYKNNIISAAITGISGEGKLILETVEKEKLECNFKEIEFII